MGINQREKNIEVFQDTEALCKENLRLKESIEYSKRNQYVLKQQDLLEVDEKRRYAEPAKILVSKKRSLEAAAAYKGQKVCVHNFASATNPGGGVTKGSNAQEEAICRCSTLYFNISEKKVKEGFHDYHRNLLRSEKMDMTYNDDCIYTPCVTVFKSDTSSPTLMPEDEWYDVDIITCAAPNLRIRKLDGVARDRQTQSIPLKDSQLKELHVKRMSRILDIAKKEQEEVVILGAFGCGAFANSPRVVAEAMASVLKEYAYDFKTIEFAIYCPPMNTENYDVFYRRIRTKM